MSCIPIATGKNLNKDNKIICDCQGKCMYFDICEYYDGTSYTCNNQESDRKYCGFYREVIKNEKRKV